MTHVSSLDIYEALTEKILSISTCVENGEYDINFAADLVSGVVVFDVAEDLGIEEDKVREILTDAVVPCSPWYSFYHNFVFPMDRVNRSLEENPPKKTGSWGWIYIMEDPSSDLYKIGKSIDPNDRLANLNRNLTPQALPYSLRVSIKVPEYSSVEEQLHQLYADKRQYAGDGQGSEWFMLDERDIDEIFDYLVALR